MVALTNIASSSSTSYLSAAPEGGASSARSSQTGQSVVPGRDLSVATSRQILPEEGKQPSEQQVKQAVEDANKSYSGSNETIGFTYEKRLNLLYVQVLDKKTGEVIKEIPPKEFLEQRIAMRERIGLILDKVG